MTAVVATLVTALSASASGQVQTPPVAVHARGAPIEVSLIPRSPSSRTATEWAKGELLAASADSLWLLTNSGFLSLSRDRLNGVRIDRGGKYGIRYAVRRGAWFGLITGAVLTGACATVEDAGGQCILVAPISVAFSAGAGLIAGLFLDSERRLTIRAPSVDALRPWSRFPQGLPEAFPRGRTAGQ